MRSPSAPSREPTSAGFEEAGPIGALHWASWLIGVLALAALAAIVLQLGEVERFLRLLQSLTPAWLVLAAALQITTYVCVAGAWWLGLDRAGARRPLRRLVGLAAAKLFVDQSVPTGGIGGTAFVVAALARQGVPRSACVGALISNFLGYYGAYLLAALTAMALLEWHHTARPWMEVVTAVFVLVALAIPAALMVLRHYGPRAPGWLARLSGIATLLDAMAEAPLARLLGHTGVLAGTAGLNLAAMVLDASTLWTMLHALGLAAAFQVAYSSFLLAMMVATISPIPMGLGTYEAACVAALASQGVPLEGALAATLLLRGCTTWLPMLPGLWLARLALHRPRPA